MDIQDLRLEYTRAGLRRADLDPDPVSQCQAWLGQAIDSGVREPTAMTLATVDADGRPSARTVLLKGVDRRGFLFFTNYESRKGRALSADPRAALTILWRELERQICVEGDVVRTSREESEAYFGKRPRGSRLGAWVSRQSQTVPNREHLERAMEEVEAAYPGETTPTPPHWGGYLLAPRRIEFWQGRPNRLHDRLEYRAADHGQWRIQRLAP